MNLYRKYTYTYQAVLENGTVVEMGFAASETSDNGGVLSSSFRGHEGQQEECFDSSLEENASGCLIHIVNPENVAKLWDDQDISFEKHEMEKMLSLCGLSSDMLAGILVTVHFENNWDEEWWETSLISRKQG